MINYYSTSKSYYSTISSIISRPSNFITSGLKQNLGKKKKPKTGKHGRGTKGRSARNKAVPYIRFEGGQAGMVKAFPMIGHSKKTPSQQLQYAHLHLDTLQYLIDSGKLNPRQPITMKELVQVGLMKRVKDGIVLLARGGEHLNTCVNIQVSKASQDTISRIHELGGSIECVYHSRERLFEWQNPDRIAVAHEGMEIPRDRLLLMRYMDPKRNGYLAHLVKDIEPENRLSHLLSLIKEE